MKLKTSLTDVAFAVIDGELLSELEWNIWDTDRNLEEGLFAEGVMRNLIQKIVFDSIKPHDLELCRNMLLNSKCSKSGYILINDK